MKINFKMIINKKTSVFFTILAFMLTVFVFNHFRKNKKKQAEMLSNSEFRISNVAPVCFRCTQQEAIYDSYFPNFMKPSKIQYDCRGLNYMLGRCQVKTDEDFMNFEKQYNPGIIKYKKLGYGTFLLQEKYENKDEAAKLMYQLQEKSMKLVKHLNNKYPEDDRTRRLNDYYKPSELEENDAQSGNTAYSVDKGKKLVICLRDNKTNKLHPINILVFVLVHEMTHIANKTYGHDSHFWDNFEFMLKEAVSCNIYRPVNYYDNPVTYCGMEITTTPIYTEAGERKY